MLKWQIRQLFARIAVKNSSSLKVNRHSTGKRDSRMNHRDVQNAEEPEKLKEDKTTALEGNSFVN